MDSFKGPLFIVGKPRSGTKLLNSIMRNHSKIQTTNIETMFIPYFIKTWSKKNLRDAKIFSQMYHDISKTSYFLYRIKNKNLIGMDKWFNLCESYEAKDVIEALIRYDTNNFNKNIIWGDKSPNYITQTKRLKKTFPEAKFIHIVRDVRDSALSSNKLWKKNILRYSSRWYNDIVKFNNDKKHIDNKDTLEIRYEDLLSQPQNTMLICCNFLSINFEENMINLKVTAENYGAAKGMTKIKNDNFNKYKKELPIQTIKDIERITWPLLDKYGYEYNYMGDQKSLSKLNLLCYRIQDVLNRIFFDFKINGIREIKFILKQQLSFFKK